MPPPLPPGEEGLPALEALCVGRRAGSRGSPGYLHGDREHLDQLQGGLALFHGLAQVEELGGGGESGGGKEDGRGGEGG